MEASEVQKLKHGLYKIKWVDGGSSLASVGSLNSGERWFAPTNWTSDKNPIGTGKSWGLVKKVKLIKEG